MTDTLREASVNLKITKNDLLYLELVSILGSVPKVISLIFSLCLPIAIIYCRINFGASLLLCALSFVPLALYINLFVRILPQTAENNYKGGSYFGRTPLFTVDKNAIHIEKSTGDISDITLDNLHSVWETPGYFYFSITKNNTIILPKRQLTLPQKKFVRSVKMSMPRKKRRNPENPTLGRLLISIITTVISVFGLTIAVMSVVGLLRI